jgi:hypothetical protein
VVKICFAVDLTIVDRIELVRGRGEFAPVAV